MKVFKKSRKTLLAGILMAAGTSWAGPVILMGIDAEDGGPGGHGALSVYTNVVSNLLAGVTNNIGGNVLVLGSHAGQTANFWTALDATIAAGVTLGDSALIGAQSFAGYAAIAIVSDANNTSGGLTAAENNILTTRQADIAAFVNAGGGLLGFSSVFGAASYGYVGGLGGFTTATPPQFSDVTATLAGNGVGITNTNLDVCCWHQTFTTYPSFLNVLATVTPPPLSTGEVGQAVAIGGATVTITPVPEPATLTLLGIGLAGLGLARRRQKQEVAKA